MSKTVSEDNVDKVTQTPVANTGLNVNALDSLWRETLEIYFEAFDTLCSRKDAKEIWHLFRAKGMNIACLLGNGMLGE